MVSNFSLNTVRYTHNERQKKEILTDTLSDKLFKNSLVQKEAVKSKDKSKNPNCSSSMLNLRTFLAQYGFSLDPRTILNAKFQRDCLL